MTTLLWQTAPAELLILGASTRAAAHSACRAGWHPLCADVFADEDLRDVADVFPVHRYPEDLIAAALDAPPCPVIYTGAVENHPQVIEAASRGRVLWGNPADVVRAVRDPFAVRSALLSAGLSALDLRPESAPPPHDGTWLVKPRASGSGRAIRVWTADETVPTESHFFQRVVGGPSYAALFIGDAQSCRCVGATLQLIGCDLCHAPPFAYCGSIGPVTFEPNVGEELERIGFALHRAFGLRGLFGVDFAISAGHVWVFEVNPRYTASVEALELSLGVPLLEGHRFACESFTDRSALRQLSEFWGRFPSIARRPESGGSAYAVRHCVGKAVLFAPHELVVPALHEFAEGPHLSQLSVLEPGAARLADIPAAGTWVRGGQPICTVLAAGEGAIDCRRRLADGVRRTGRLLAGRSQSWEPATRAEAPERPGCCSLS